MLAWIWYIVWSIVISPQGILCCATHYNILLPKHIAGTPVLSRSTDRGVQPNKNKNNDENKNKNNNKKNEQVQEQEQ